MPDVYGQPLTVADEIGETPMTGTVQVALFLKR
jgi:hypothetical protein